MAYTGKSGGYRGGNQGGGNWSGNKSAPAAATAGKSGAAATPPVEYTSQIVSTFLLSKFGEGKKFYTRVDERTMANLSQVKVGDVITFAISDKEDAKFPAQLRVTPAKAE